MLDTVKTELLRALPLFKNVKEATLQQALSMAEPCKRVSGGSFLQTPESPRALGILLEGKAQIFSADTAKSVVLRTLSAPAVFGAASLFLPSEQPLSRVVAEGSCEYVTLGETAVAWLLEHDRQFLFSYLAFLSDRVRFLNEKIACFTAGSAERRLALWLAADGTNTMTLPVSLSDLSDMLDIGRASLYRAFDKLTAEGFILKNGREITLVDRDAMLKKYR